MKEKDMERIILYGIVIFLIFASCVYLGYRYSIQKTGSPIIEDHDFIKEPIYFPFPTEENFYLIQDYEEYYRLMRKSKIADEKDFKNHNVLVIRSNYRACDSKEIITGHEIDGNRMRVYLSYQTSCEEKNCKNFKEVAGYYYMKVPKNVVIVLLKYQEVFNTKC